jgi:hypothetical protein
VFRKTLWLLAAAVVGLSATAATADDGRWLYVGSDESGAGFIDLNTISGGMTPELKLILVPGGFREGDHSAMYFAIVRVQVDCAARSTQLLSAKGYSDVGDLVMSHDLEPPEAVDPAELAEVNTLRVACRMPGAPSDLIFDSSTAAIDWWHRQ